MESKNTRRGLKNLVWDLAQGDPRQLNENQSGNQRFIFINIEICSYRK